MKKKGFPLLLIVFLLLNGCASKQTGDENFIDYSGLEGILQGAADGQEATVSMNFPIIDIPESSEDDVHYIAYLEDKNVEENPVFHAFIQNEITAYDQTEDQKLYMTDFFLKLHPDGFDWWRGIHYMAEDLDGDGDEELLVYLGWGVQVADLYVFDEIDGKLYAWETWEYFYTWRMSAVEYCGDGVFSMGGSDGHVFGYYNSEGKIEDIMEFYRGRRREDGIFRLYENGSVVKELSYEGDYFNEEGLTPDNREIVDEINTIMEEIRNKYGRGKQIREVSAYDEAEQIPLEDLLSMWQTNSSAKEINTFEELIDSLSLEDSPYSYILERWEEVEYGYYDVNDDGVDELIFYSGSEVTIFMYLNDEIQMVCSYSYSKLLENGMVWYHRPGAAPNHDDYQCLVFDGEEYQEVFYISRYDWDQDGVYAEDGAGDIYFYCNFEETPDADIYDNEISKSEYEKILRPYLECQEAELHDGGVIVNNFFKK